jgi:manganese/iron transport system substrate-binding protein
MAFSRYCQPTWKTTVLCFTVGLLTSCATATDTRPEGAATNAASPVATTKAPKVVATTSVICDLTKRIAEATIQLTCIGNPGQDPHVYQPTPGDRKAIEEADLVLYGGYDFEPNLIKVVQATSSQAPKVAVHEQAVTQPLMGVHDHGHGDHSDHDHDHDHSHDHDHGDKAKADQAEEKVADPHVWHDARNGMKMAETIATSLKKVAPTEAETYDRNAQKLKQELQQLDAWIRSQIATIPANQRKLITTHDALGYFSEAYGIPVEGALQGISTNEKPTAARIKELVEQIRTTQVPTIFAEQTVNPKLIETVAREANVSVSQRRLFADGLGEPGSGAETYDKMLIANTRTIVEGLGGTYTPFQPK